MNRAQKSAVKKTASPKKALKVSKRNLKTKSKKITSLAPATTNAVQFAQPSLFMAQRRKMSAGPNNIKHPHQLNNEEFDKYNNMLPSSTLTEQWEEQLDRLDADIEQDEASLSTDVEEYIQEHGDTITTFQQPAQIQFNIFNEDPQFEVSKRLIGPPGTVEEPTMVFSPKPYRIVGCVGTLEDPHQLGWFSMEGYLKHMCPTCAQVFQLTNNPDECDFSYVEKVDNMKHFVGH